MVCGVTSQKKLFWLVVVLVATARAQPVALDVPQEGPGAVQEGPGGELGHRKDLDLQVLTPDLHQGPQDVLASTLSQFIRRGRQLQEGTGRQTAATLASSLGGLLRPAITAFVGALTMNSATSITNAITALLGGRSLDVIPPETFMMAPAGRDDRVPQPTRESEEGLLKRRPSRRRQRPAGGPYLPAL